MNTALAFAYCRIPNCPSGAHRPPVCRIKPMMLRHRVKHLVPNASTTSLQIACGRHTVKEVTLFVGRMGDVDIDELLLDDCRLPPDEMFDDLYGPKDQSFVFSRPSTAAVTPRPHASSPSFAAPRILAGNRRMRLPLFVIGRCQPRSGTCEGCERSESLVRALWASLNCFKTRLRTT
jgi:hypothetical protein